MAKSQVIETIEREGHTIKLYDNGMEYDDTTKKIVKPPVTGQITKANAQEMALKRKAKASSLLRQAIIEAHNRKMTPVTSSAAAFAESGALLYEEIVLGSAEEGVYPRDRVQTWKALGVMAEVLEPNNLNRTEQEKNMADAWNMAAVTLLNALREAVQPREVINGTATDIRNDLAEENG